MQATPSLKPPTRRRTFFLLGIVFELVLLLLCYVLPECWLQVEVHNFTLITHSPLMLLMMVLAGVWGRNENLAVILGLPICLAVMATVWGFLIYAVTRLIKGVLDRLVVSQRQ